MAKVKSIYVCSDCGAEYSKWQGKCNSCGAWNTVSELRQPKMGKGVSLTGISQTASRQPVNLNEVDQIEVSRISLPDKELERALGGGLVPGSVTLLAGEPGIGKSTLLLQLGLKMSDKKVLYVSGEESESQIRMRADRISARTENFFLYCETQLEQIMAQIENLQPDLLIIDSIQTMWSEMIESSPGTVSQVRECSAALIRQVKPMKIPVFLIGHITKEGNIAGPKVLEHMVDAVLTFEGDRHNQYRIVRNRKNRFGSTLEMAVYEMRQDGMREVSNPSEVFITSAGSDNSGIAIAATMEGARSLLVECQALVTPLAYGTPQRSATGYDTRRLNMLLAVLEKRCGFPMAQKDVFINIAGGIKIEDPALDLALVTAIVSSLHDIPVGGEKVFAGEIGLSGEIRPVPRMAARVAEAGKLGFKNFFFSEQASAELSTGNKIRLHPVENLKNYFAAVFS